MMSVLLAKYALVEEEAELCAAFAGIFWLSWLLLQGRHRRALPEGLAGLDAAAPYCDFQLL